MGYEEPVSAVIAEEWRSLVDELATSPLGSLHGLRKASAEEKRPSLMIATHMDAIGLIVKQVRNGLLEIAAMGGIDPRNSAGAIGYCTRRKREFPGSCNSFQIDCSKKSQPAKLPPLTACL